MLANSTSMPTKEVGEDEVARLFSRAVMPRLPRSTAELSIALGRQMTPVEQEVRNQASMLGGVTLAGEIEDLILADADADVLRERIEEFAAELSAELSKEKGAAVGGEVARILSDRARSRR